MKTKELKSVNNAKENNFKKGISLIVLVITIVITLILLSVIVLSLTNSNPANKADEAVFRNDYVVLQNELTSSKLNEKINDFSASEDINISMKDDEIYDWLPSLLTSPLKGYVEICNGEVVFIVSDDETDERQWAENIAGADKVCESSCAEAPKVFSPELTANVKSGEMSLEDVKLNISGGIQEASDIEYWYEYSLDKGKTFEKVTDDNGTSISFNDSFLRQIVQVRTVAIINEKEEKSKVSEFEVYINKTGILAPIITATNGYISGTWTGNTVTLLISHADSNMEGTLQYAVAKDNDEYGKWIDYDSNSTDLTFTEDGEYRVKARTVVDSEKVGATSEEFLVKINKAIPDAPIITATVNGGLINSNVWTNKRPVVLYFSLKSKVSYYEYSLDGGITWTKLTQDNLQINDLGKTKVTARAYSMIGEVGASSDAFVVKIDQEKPLATISLSPTTNSIQMSVKASDGNGGSGVDTYLYYKDNELVATTKDSEYIFKNLTQDTSYKLGVVVIDAAGNSSQLVYETINTLKIPSPSIVLDNKNWTNSNVLATISTNDSLTLKVKYQVVSRGNKLVESDWREYSLPITISQNSDIYAIALDNTNQESEPTLVSVEKIDKNDPDTKAPSAVSTTRKITVTCNQKDLPQTDAYGSSGINEEKVWYAIKKGDLWSEYQYSNEFDNLDSDTYYSVRTRAYDNAGNYSVSEETEIKTQDLEIGKLKFTLVSSSNKEYIPGTLTNEDVKIELEENSKNNTTFYSKLGSAQYVSKTTDDTIIQTEGITKIIVETTDGYNVKTQEYDVMIDKTAPNVSAIEVISPESGKYKLGTKVTIKTTWTENLKVIKAPVMKIKFGDSVEREATYVSNSNNEIIYEYVIQKDDNGTLILSDYLDGQVSDSVNNVGYGTKKELTGNSIIAANEFSVTIVSSPMNAGKVSGVTSAIYLDDVTVSATANPGYVFKKWIASSKDVNIQNELSETTSFKMPAQDVTLTASFGYIEYKIKYDANGGSGTSFESEYTYDKLQKLAKNTYVKDGYTFAGWNRDKNATEPEFLDEEEILNLTDKDGEVITLYAIWKVGISEYKVEHYIENSNSTAYILKEVENLTLTTDELATAKEKSYLGFYYDENLASNVVSGIVTGDGKLVLKLYYTRKSYTLSIDPNGGTYNGSSDISNIVGKYEASVALATPIKQGYIFNGWIITGSGNVKSNKFVFDASDATVTASWKPGISQYTIEYYKENIDSTGYDFAEKATMSATTDSNVQALIKDYEGFSNNDYIEGTLLSGVVKSDNSLVLKVYYVRNTYNLTIEPNGGEYRDVSTSVVIPGKYETIEKVDDPTPKLGYKITYNANGGSTKVSEDYTSNVFYNWTKQGIGEFNSESKEFKYLAGDGTLIANYKNDGIILTDATRQGYTFNGWYKGVKKVGNANDKYIPESEETLIANWIPNEDTKYKVEHYIENIAKDGFELFETDNLVGITDTNVSAISKMYEGFTFDSTIDGSVLSGNINPDGSLVLKLYYTRNVHTLSFLVTPINSSGSITKAGSYAYGQTVEIAALPNTGYMFSNWVVSTNNTTVLNPLDKTTSFTMPDSDVSITANFIAISYTVKYDANSGIGTMLNTIHEYNKPQNLSKNTFTKQGYSFIGWSTNKDAKTAEFLDEQEVVNLASENGSIITLYAIWSAGNANYTAEYYIEQLDGTYELYNKKKLTGSVDSSVNIEVEQIKGFEYDPSNKNSILSGTVASDGSLVLKSYYNRKSYTLSIDPNTGTYNSSTNVLSIVGKYEETIELAVPIKTGYTFNGWITESKGSISQNSYTFSDSDEKIKATYNANEYTVTYNYMNANGDNTEKNKVVTFDLEYGTLPQPTRNYSMTYDLNNGTASITDENTKSKYEFNGWYTSKEYNELIVSTSIVKIASNHTLYAKWINGSVKLLSPTRVGFSFGGWYLSESNNNGSGTKAGDANASYVPTKDITLYAGWIPNEDTPYKVEHYLENVTATGFDLKETENLSGTTGKTVTATSKVYDGYTLDNSYKDSLISSTISADGSLVLKLYYTRNSYNLTINPNGGTFRSTKNNTIITKKHGQTEIIENPTTPAAYKITYNTDGGNVTLTEQNTTAKYTFLNWKLSGLGAFDATTKQYTYGIGTGTLTAQYSLSNIVLPNATKEGCIFDGWYSDSELKNKVGDSLDTFTPSQSTTLYAKWIERTDLKYQVYHYLENAQGTDYELQVDDIETGYGKLNQTVTATKKSYNGFTYDSSISGTLESANIKADGSLILKLYYTRNLYSLTVNPNGGEWGSTKDLTVINKKHGQTLLINDPTPPEKLSVSYELNGGEASLTKENTDSVVTFKNWKKTGIGNFDSNTKTFTYGIGTALLLANYETGKIVLPNATKVGYVFLGWYNDSNFTTKIGNALDEYTPTTNEKLYAKYMAATDTVYMVEYYLENVDGTGYDLNNTDILSGATDTKVEATLKTYTGFTFDKSNVNNVSSGNINPDGSLVLKLYYTRNSYNLTINPNGGTFRNQTTSTTLTKKYGSTETIENPSVPAPYTVQYNANGGILTITDKNTLAKKTFSSWTKTGVGTLSSSNVFTFGLGNATITANYTNGSVQLPSITKQGYTFNGWYNGTTKVGIAGATYTPSDNVTLTASFTANKVAYKVEHYLQDLDGVNYTLKETQNLTGYTDSTVSCTSKTYTGFTYDSSNKNNVKSGIVNADGSLTLKLYYTRNSYTVSLSVNPANAGKVTGSGTYKYGQTVSLAATVNNGYTFNSWSTLDSIMITDTTSETTTFVMVADDVNITATYNVIGYKINYLLNGGTQNVSNPTSYMVTSNDFTLNNPTKEGYVFKGWSTPSDPIPYKDVTIEKGSIGDRTYIANWQYATVDAVDIGSQFVGFDSVLGTANTSDSGSFTIYVQEADYVFDVQSVGTTNLYVSDSLDGTYTKVLSISEDLETYITTKACYIKIEGDNWNLNVKLNTGENAYIADKLPKYTLTAYLNDSTDTVYDATTYRKYSLAKYPAKPTRDGYEFKGWSTSKMATSGAEAESDFGYISENTKIYATWAKATYYRVEYYLENVTKTGYELYDAEVIQSVTGNNVEATVRDYTSLGFDYNSSASGSIISGTVLEDGSLTLKVYYTRRSYNLTINPNGGTYSDNSSNTVINKPHGSSINILVPVRPGYDFAGWTKSGLGTITANTPIVSTIQKFTYGLGNTTITANWKAIEVNYTVEHYKQNLDYTFSLANTETLSAVTGTNVTATAKSYQGFNYSKSYSGSITSGVVKGDGSLVLKLYYTRKEVTLTINPNGGSYDNDIDKTVKNGMYGQTIEVDGKIVPPVGYKVIYNVNGGTPDKVSETSTKSFSSWTLSGYGSYDLTTKTFTLGNGNGTLTASYSNNSVILPNVTYVGYTLDGWYSDSEFKTRVGSAGAEYTPTENITLYAKKISNDDTKYTVEHYLENVDGTYSATANYKDTLYGETDSPVTAIANTYTGYTQDMSISGTIASGKVAADGSLVLKLYYKRNYYTLTLSSSPSTGGTVEKSGSYKYGSTVTIKASAKSGYSFNGWSTTTTGIQLNSTSAATTSFVMPAKNVSITGNFKTNVYTLTLNPGGTQYSQNYLSTKSVTAPKAYYTIKYDSNGGTSFSSTNSERGFSSWTLTGAGSISSTTANPVTYTYGAGSATLTANYNDKGTSYTLPTPSRLGYTFNGWYDSETNNNGSGNLVGLAGATYTPTSDKTLYAKWTINSYVLTINPGGETKTAVYASKTNITAPKSYYTITYDVNGGNSIDSYKSERAFSSWTLTGAGSISSTTANPVEFTYGAGASTLTASYNANGTTYTLPSATKKGYTFEGWYSTETNNNGSGTLIGKAGASYTPSANKTLYAKWTINSYTLTVKNGSTVLATYSGNYNTTKSVSLSPKYTIKFNTNGGTEVSNMTSNRTVSSWNLSGAGSISSTTTNPTVFTYGEGDATLTATYSTTGEAITLPSTSKTGYTFNYWCTDSSLTKKAGSSGIANSSFTPSGSSETINLYAKFTINSYTVSTSSNPTAGGSVEGSGKYNYGSLVALKATANAGYTFEGWYNGSVKVSSDANYTFTLGAANVSLIAKFKAEDSDYKVNHYVMNTSGTYPTTPTLTETKSATTDSTITISNLQKTTSQYKVTNGIAYSYGQVGGTTVTTTTILGDGSRVINLYYKRYYGTLTTKAGTNISSVTTQNAVKYYYGATVPTLTATLSTSTGYTIAFSAWASSNTTYMTNKTSNPTGTFTWPAMPEGTAVTLTANATKTANTYTITLSNSNATTNASPSTIYEKYATGIYSNSVCTTTVSKITAPKRTGYTFGGYYTNTNGAGTQMIAADGSFTTSFTNTAFSANTTLYPKWTANSVSYKVEHYVMGTNGSYPTSATSTQTLSGTADSTLTLSNLQKTDSAYKVTNGIAYSYGQVGGKTVTTTTILPDGSRVIKLYYERYYGTLTTKAGDNVSSVTTQSAVKYYYGATVPTLSATLMANPTGYYYKFSGWTSSNTTYMANKTSNPTGTFTWPAMPKGTAITLTASATKQPNTGTAYTVEHYVMGTNGTYPATPTSTDSKSGTTGATLTLSSLKNSKHEVTNGIVYSYGQVGGKTVTTTTITADGTTVIKLYYKRTYGTLTTATGNYVSSVSPAQSKTKYYYGATVPTLTANLATYTGYTVKFSSWTSSNTAVKVSTNPTGTFTWPAMAEGTAVTLTANATKTANTYTITLSNSNATTNASPSTIYEKYATGIYSNSACTTTVSKITAPKRTGYTFGGYYTNTNGAGTQMIAADGSFTTSFTNTAFSANTTLYPKWTANSVSYKVEHYVMGTNGSYPTSATSTQTLSGTADSTLTLSNLQKTDSAYKVTNGIAYSYGQVGGKTVTTTTILPDGSRVIKLYYERYYGTLTTKAGTNISSVTTQSAVKYYYGATVPTLTATLSTSTGYTTTFSKWTSSNTTYMANKTSNPTGTFTWPAMPKGTAITLTASATKTINTSSLTINPNGGSVSVTSPTGGTATTISASKTYTQNYNTTLTYGTPTKSNATSKTTYTVSFNGNGGTVSTTSLTATKTTTTTYTFSGWTKSSIFYGTLSSTTANGTYTFPSNKGVTSTITAGYTSSSSSATTSVTLPTPTRTGYTFNGWYTASSGGTKAGAAGATYTPTATLTLYAQWTINTSSLTINPNGGSVSVTSPTGGTATTISASKTYTQNYNTTLTYGTPTKSNATSKTTYTVSFNGNGGTVSTTSLTATKTTTTTYTFSGWTKSSTFYGTLSSTTANGTYTFPSNKGVTSTITAGYTSSSSSATTSVTLPTPTRTGYTFNGWYTASSGGTKAGAAGATYTPTATLTLYAQWTPIVYTITLDNQSATTAGSTAVYEKYNTGIYKESGCTNKMTTSANAITIPVKTGSVFAGYYTGKNGTGTQMISPTGYITSNFTNTKYTANTTLYAYWQTSTIFLRGKSTTTGYSVDTLNGKIGLSGNNVWFYIPGPGYILEFTTNQSGGLMLKSEDNINASSTTLLSESGTYVTTSDGYYSIGGNSGTNVVIKTADGNTCKILDFLNISILRAYTNINTDTDFLDSPYNNFITKGGVDYRVYVNQQTTSLLGGVVFSSSQSGTSISGSSAIDNTYTSVGSVFSSGTYTTTTQYAYYKFYGSSMTINVKGANGSAITVKNELPQVLIYESYSTNMSLHTISGNRIVVGGGEVALHSTGSGTFYVTNSSGIVLKRGNTLDGSFTSFGSVSPGSTGNFEFTISYYYKLSGGNSTIYLKDSNGSAVQFVTQ